MSNLSDAALLARRFPAVLPLLETGAISLTVLGLLKPHLTDDKHREFLCGVSGVSVRRAKEWLAARFPMPDVPSSIRKLPERLRSATSSPTDSVPAPDTVQSASTTSMRVPAGADRIIGVQSAPPRVPSGAEPASLIQSAPTRVLNGPQPTGGVQCTPTMGSGAAAVLRARQAPRVRVEPLSSDRFLVKLTASRALRDKLELARDSFRPA